MSAFTYNNSLKSFDINATALIGNDGTPVMNDKMLIGMLDRQLVIESNQDIIKHPNFVSYSAKVIKARYIMSLLKKLQKIENSPGF